MRYLRLFEDNSGSKLELIKNIIKENQFLSKYADQITEDSLKEFNEYILEKSDPKVGTGKKPKGSSRRLYTDENPKDTVSVKFRTLEDIRATINSPSFKSKSHKRQSQILNLIEQRVRVAHGRAKDPETKRRLKRAHDYIKSKCEKSKEKTKRLNESIESTEQDLKDILVSLNCKTQGLESLADLLNPLKLFPNSYKTLTVPVYNTQGGPANSKVYYPIYTNEGLNSNLTSPIVSSQIGAV